MTGQRCILFTAFETSGDEHAAPVIRVLRRQLPDVPIFAMGGPRMAAAGATLLEQTTGTATMGAVGLKKIAEQLRLRKQMRQWLEDHPVAVHVPTDSPAANWAMVKAVKTRWPDAKTVHLVAPQVWAWAQWRVKRLKKWSDHVLCLLPFEPDWFTGHGVNATFIGHPLFDEPLNPVALGEQGADLPDASPRIALLPGSRMGEVKANGRDLLRIFQAIREKHSQAAAVIASVDQKVADQMNGLGAAGVDGVHMAIGRTPAVLHWADVVISVSGTVTLHVARHGRPMVIMYRISPLQWHLVGRWLVDTRTFTLPNLIAAGEASTNRRDHIVPEFVPLTGSIQPVIDEAVALVGDELRQKRQVEALKQVVKQFDGHDAATEAADIIVDKLKL